MAHVKQKYRFNSPEERDGSPTGKVSEDQEGHTLGHGEVRVGRRGIVSTDGAVHGGVTGGDNEEGQAVDQQQGDEVG